MACGEDHIGNVYVVYKIIIVSGLSSFDLVVSFDNVGRSDLV